MRQQPPNREIGFVSSSFSFRVVRASGRGEAARALEAMIGQKLDALQTSLPFHPPLYPADTLTDKPEKFFASEIIREKILLLYGAEVPYSCEVEIKSFKDEPELLRIGAVVYVARVSDYVRQHLPQQVVGAAASSSFVLESVDGRLRSARWPC